MGMAFMAAVTSVHVVVADRSAAVLLVVEGLPGVVAALIGCRSALTAQPLRCLCIAATVSPGVRLAPPAIAFEPGQPLGSGQLHFDELVTDLATTVGGDLPSGPRQINAQAPRAWGPLERRAAPCPTMPMVLGAACTSAPDALPLRPPGRVSSLWRTSHGRRGSRRGSREHWQSLGRAVLHSSRRVPLVPGLPMGQ